MNIWAKTGAAALSVGLVAGFGTVTFTTDADAAWEPRKPVDFVIMAGKGGGADRLARFIQGIIQKEKLAKRPFVPVNKGGGSGAEALRQLKDSGGNPHMILATLNSYYTTPLRNPGLGVDIANFTPIARLAEDTFQLWVTADSGIKSVEDYIKSVKAAGRAGWKMGGTGKGQEDSLVTAMLEQKFKIGMTYVPFKGGGTVAKQLVGKHINSTVNNPSEQVGFWDAGKSVPLASFTPKGKLKGKWGNIPTFEELGYGNDMVYYMQRSIVGSPGMPKDARDYYVSVFDKVYKSDAWQKYLTSKGLVPGWLTGDELQTYFLAERAKHAKLLKDLGEIK